MGANSALDTKKIVSLVKYKEIYRQISPSHHYRGILKVLIHHMEGSSVNGFNGWLRLTFPLIGTSGGYIVKDGKEMKQTWFK